MGIKIDGIDIIVFVYLSIFKIFFDVITVAFFITYIFQNAIFLIRYSSRIVTFFQYLFDVCHGSMLKQSQLYRTISAQKQLICPGNWWTWRSSYHAFTFDTFSFFVTIFYLLHYSKCKTDNSYCIR